MKLLLCVLAFLAVYYAAEALECYTCSVGEQDPDKTCIDDPKKLQKTNCNKKYCTIIRQEYKDPKDKVVSIYRGCDDQPLYINEIVEDATYRMYYSACQENLCNGGSGRSGDGSDKPQSLGDKSTLLVPGTGNSGHLVHISLFLILLTVLIHFIFI